MSLQYTCDKCGTRFNSSAFGMEAGWGHFSGNMVSCPVPGCTGTGHHKPGLYEFANGVVVAFTAPGMTREKVEAVRDIATKVQAGEITSEQAKEATARQDPSLAKVWEWIGNNDRQLIVLLTVIGLLLAHYHFRNAGADAQADQEVCQSAAQASQRNAQALERIGAELEKMNLAPPAPANLAPLSQPPRPSVQAQTSAPKNRAERRKADAIERRAKRRDE